MPAAHIEQAVFDGEDALYCPVKQAAQEACPATPWYKPFAQRLQPVATDAEYWPAAQMPVAAVRPATEQYEPAGHEPHEPDPELGWKVPAAQLVQKVDATAEYKPALHIVHIDEDVAAATFDDLPAAHP